jgi:tetratricopeptide (TPR) repeat protein
MKDELREKIRANLLEHDTPYLIDIWQNGTTEDWAEDVFILLEEILLERLGSLPPVSIEKQTDLAIAKAQAFLENDEPDLALAAWNQVIALAPETALAYENIAEIYEQRGDQAAALANYRKALELDPHLKFSQQKLRTAEQEQEEAFLDSEAKACLDMALDYANQDEQDLALAECERAIPLLPEIAVAHNYLGLIYHSLRMYEQAAASYQKAVSLNPRYRASRVNLADTLTILEEENYLGLTDHGLPGMDELQWEESSFDAQEDAGLAPQWLFMDKQAYFLVGWPGHRNRYGRSGYDPLEKDFEYAHMQGTILRLCLNGKFRTKNPLYLLFMTIVGVVYCLYGAWPFMLESLRWEVLMTSFTTFPILLAGVMLLRNVVLSFFVPKDSQLEETGLTFF